ncbi:hypothetical protein ACHAWC_007028 [Mediolabrus comicus]
MSRGGGASYANHDRRRGVSSRSSSSRQSTSSRRVYERYDVNIPGIIGNTYSIEEARMRRNQRLLLYLVAMLIFVISWVTFLSSDDTTNKSASNKIVKVGSSYVNMNVQTADEQQSSTNDNIIKQKQKLTNEQQIEQQQILDDIHFDKKRASAAEGGKTTGSKGGPCRVRNPDAPPEYRCDDGGVCIMAVGTPKSQFKGKGVYYDDSCDNQCGDGREGQRNSWIANGKRCNNDWDCSLAGTCSPEGICQCDPWADGVDCSYLKFQPVHRNKLGYLDEQNTSWGGSIIQSEATGMYHMYVSEILCKIDGRTRCGLNAWQTHSQVVETVSAEIDGPYQRVKVVLPPEHHNPSVHVSPTTGHWHLFSISGPSGPIERVISQDEGKTWGNPMTISPEQNPGPVLMPDGSTRLFFRADGMDIPSPTCSDEGIGVQICPSETEPCNPSSDTPILAHTGEDPSVFVDHRGNYHMLFNALPYKCVPKFQQGGHAWSKDGIEWKTPRVGAFDTTIHFSDGSSMKCERRERPQMVLRKDGMPLALISAVTGCPKALGEEENSWTSNPYKGGDDAFTIIQKMGTIT